MFAFLFSPGGIIKTPQAIRKDAFLKSFSNRLIVNMFYKMAQLRKNEFRTGQLAGVEAARHAKHNRIADNTGSGAGHDGGGIDFFHAEFGKQGANRGPNALSFLLKSGLTASMVTSFFVIPVPPLIKITWGFDSLIPSFNAAAIFRASSGITS
jgi:hypothetical protein